MAASVNAFRERYPDWKNYIHDLLDELGARRKNSNQPVGVSTGNSPAQNIKVVNKNVSLKKVANPLASGEQSGETCVKDPMTKIDGKLDVSKGSFPDVKKSRFSSQWQISEVDSVADRVSHTGIHKKDCVNSSQGVSSAHSMYKVDHQISSTRKSSGIAEVKRFHELCESEERVPNESKELVVLDDTGNSDNDDEITDGQVVDPFFVKPDGKTEYITKMVVGEGDDGDEKDNFPSLSRGEKHYKGSQGWNEGGWGAKEGVKGSRGGGQGSRGGRGSFSGRGHPRRGRGGHGGERLESEHGRRGHDQSFQFAKRNEAVHGRNSKFPQKNQPMVPKNAEHLHPSWEAKRKLKEQSISNIAFQGKKIKFDDDD